MGFRVQNYGITKHKELFTIRQLFVLNTFADLIKEVENKIYEDALKVNFPEDKKGISNGGKGAKAYAEAIITYLSFCLSRLVEFHNSFASWNIGSENIRQIFERPTVQMTWDFVEINPFYGKVTFLDTVNWISTSLLSLPITPEGKSYQLDARSDILIKKINPIISTDPPYYDNIGYADLSDIFYVWLRKILNDVYPDLFSTLLTPKANELIASPFRFGGDRQKAKEFFQEGLVDTFKVIKEFSNSQYPITIFYAFKQSENTTGDEGDRLRSSTALKPSKSE